MPLVIPDLFPSAETQGLLRELQQIELQDGKSTAGKYARDVKYNQQPNPQQTQELIQRVGRKILEHPTFQSRVLPKALQNLMVNCYSAGMEYGWHVDDVLMSDMRCDLSFTLFLSEGYDGGELIVEDANEHRSYKFPPGTLLVYRSGLQHRVAPVRAGVRWAVVGWIQSWIRRHDQREILADLDTLRQQIFENSGKTETFDLATKSFHNLLRLWAE